MDDGGEQAGDNARKGTVKKRIQRKTSLGSDRLDQAQQDI
jgi:hypothetical protein